MSTISLKTATVEQLADWISQQPICEPDNGLVIEWPRYFKHNGNHSRCLVYLSSGAGGTGKWLKTSYKDKDTEYLAIGDDVKDALIKLAKIIINQ